MSSTTPPQDQPHTDPAGALGAGLRRRWRWLVPILALVVFVGAGGVISALTSAADAALKPRSVTQLISDVHHAQLANGSGTIVQTSDLGLPALPGVAGAGSGSTGLLGLLSGTHTLRFWYAGPQQLRLALLDDMGETDLIHNGSTLWQWSSSDRSATEWALPAHAAHPMKPKLPSPGATPPQVAGQALSAASKSTSITAGPTTTVAGRKAYQLIVTPRSDTTLISSIQIAIDGRTHIPTRVRLYAKNHSGPVFEVAFTSFDTGRPPASVFAFNPPPGTKVTKKTLSDLGSSPEHSAKARTLHGKTMDSTQKSVRVVGSGWDSVLVANAPQAQSMIQQDKAIAAVVDRLPMVSGTWGSGHLFEGTAFSAVLTNDGRIAIGAVPPSALYAALATK
jgi:outer membrane lipoprotein-sorting protein